MDSYSKKTDERMDDFSRKADEMLEKFMQVTRKVGCQIQGTESEITQLLKELINEIGMDFGNGRVERTAKPITHNFINDGERNKFIRSANMLKKD